MPDRKIVVIGDEDAVFGLSLIGLEGYVVTSVKEARKSVRDAMADPDTALILLTENWFEASEPWNESAALIIEIPTKRAAKTSVALEAQIERALGIRLEP
jgi:vacuolar-type H+-ATPase subunit F/Vma7